MRNEAGSNGKQLEATETDDFGGATYFTDTKGLGKNPFKQARLGEDPRNAKLPTASPLQTAVQAVQVLLVERPRQGHIHIPTGG